MGINSFDFEAYLESVCPGEQFTITVLTGGLVNLTIRAIRTSPALDMSLRSLRNESSFILKHATPYIAALGESVPFSQFRQIIEARALRLFTRTSPFASLQCETPRVFVPRLLHHDPSLYILIVEDLGELPSVAKWLETTSLCDSIISSVSSDLGLFLANLHASTTPENHTWLEEQFKNEDATDVVFSAAVEPVLAILRDYDIPDATSIYDFLVTEFQHEHKDRESHVLNMGDLWTGSILVDPRGDKIGVIDWEFATLAAPSQDIGQLGSFRCTTTLIVAAHLCQRAMITRPAQRRYEIFARSMFESYGRRVHENNIDVPWLSSDGIEKHIRRLWTICGRELVNSVTWGKLCECKECKCEHSVGAVQKGVEYIRWAQKNSISFDHDTFLAPLYPVV